MPGGLELQRLTNLVDALRGLGEPVDLVLGFQQVRALDALDGTEFQRLALFGIGDAGEGAQVRVRRERRSLVARRPRPAPSRA